MTFASKYSKSTPRFMIKVTNPEYTTLPDLFNANGSSHVYPFYAVYINRNGKYGPQAVLALSETLLVNLPAHKLEDCEKMLTDEEAVMSINAGLAGFRIYQYNTKSGRTGFSVDWVDIKPTDAAPVSSLPF